MSCLVNVGQGIPSRKVCVNRPILEHHVLGNDKTSACVSQGLFKLKKEQDSVTRGPTWTLVLSFIIWGTLHSSFKRYQPQFPHL